MSGSMEKAEARDERILLRAVVGHAVLEARRFDQRALHAELLVHFEHEVANELGFGDEVAHGAAFHLREEGLHVPTPFGLEDALEANVVGRLHGRRSKTRIERGATPRFPGGRGDRKGEDALMRRRRPVDLGVVVGVGEVGKRPTARGGRDELAACSMS